MLRIWSVSNFVIRINANVRIWATKTFSGWDSFNTKCGDFFWKYPVWKIPLFPSSLENFRPNALIHAKRFIISSGLGIFIHSEGKHPFNSCFFYGMTRSKCKRLQSTSHACSVWLFRWYSCPFHVEALVLFLSSDRQYESLAFDQYH